MESLKNLVESFRNEERTLFEEFYSLSIHKKKAKRKQLLQLILDNPDISDAEACQKIYGKDKDSAYIHLKTGLKEDLLSMLTMLPSTSFVGLPVNVALIDCRRMIMQGHHLLSRGNRKEATRLFNKAAKLAEKYEHFGELGVIYSYLITYTGASLKFSDYMKLAEKRWHFQLLEQKTERARHLLQEISMPSNSKYRYDTEYTVIAEKALEELTALFNEYRSSRIAESYFKGRIIFSQITKDIEETGAAAEGMLAYIQGDDVLNSKNNLGGLNLVLSNTALLLNDYEKAEKHAQVAYSHFSVAKMIANQVKAMEYLFFSHMRLRKFQEALDVIESAKRHKAIGWYRFQHEKWQLYDAAIQFHLDNLEGAMKLLNVRTNIKEDRTGWYLGNRFLDMICQVEAGNYDIFEIKLQTFRRHLASVRSKISQRDQKIYHAFRALLKNKFDFSATIQNNQDLFRELQQGDDEMAWDPVGYELVRVDAWMMEKSKVKIFT